jgi:NADH-quinone oxidoreductase subunit A
MVPFYSYTNNEYFGVFIILLVASILALILIILSFFLVNQVPDSEKMSTYECGYEPYENSRNAFNIHFCTVALFFLIFDIEMLFIIPWCVSISKINLLSFWTTIDFIFELYVGFFYLWYSNALDWEN